MPPVKQESKVGYLRISIMIRDTPGNINKKMKFLDRAFINAAIDQEIDGFAVAEYNRDGDRVRMYEQGDTSELAKPPDHIAIEEKK